MTTPEHSGHDARAASRSRLWPVQLRHSAALQSASKVLRLQPFSCSYPIAGDHCAALGRVLSAHPNATHNNTSRQGYRNDGSPGCALLLLADPLDPLLLHALVCSNEPFPGSTEHATWGPYQRAQKGWQLEPETLQDLRGMLTRHRPERRAALWREMAAKYAHLAGVLRALQTLPGAPAELTGDLRPVVRMVRAEHQPLEAYLQCIEAPAWQDDA
jgi:hypothetical protein